MRLAQLDTGTEFTIARIPEELEFAAGMLDFLEKTSLVPGTRAKVAGVAENGDVVVSVQGRDVSVTPFASARILVTT
jgi:hypothetical protein